MLDSGAVLMPAPWPFPLLHPATTVEATVPLKCLVGVLILKPVTGQCQSYHTQP